MPPRSPLAPAQQPALPPIAGVRLATRACGIRYKDRADVCVIAFDQGTTVAGVFTRSLTASAPVDRCRANLKGGKARAVVINAGNANAFTGKLGKTSVDRTVKAAAAKLGASAKEIYVASTGVIGEPLPDERITSNLDAVIADLQADRWAAAAAAIMTTDTFAKAATRTAKIDGVPVTINGICKGSGMIMPDMATMLAFVATDAAIPANLLQRLLREGNDHSFNCITVDGDTSTSDTLLLFATAKAAHRPVRSAADKRLKDFRAKLNDLLEDLACQVARDGEGASKFITIDVSGAASDLAARRIGLAVANSPLVKTAIAGQDANWGRIVMAIGKAGEKANRDRLKIVIGGVTIAEKGRRRAGYDETPVVQHMKGQEIAIAFDVGVGKGRARVWSCDLTHGYIDINGSYRS
jgi:glutamate N-acetyltransferase/amino-acid N-acetyltransferase